MIIKKEQATKIYFDGLQLLDYTAKGRMSVALKVIFP